MNFKYMVSERRQTQKAISCVMPFNSTYWKRQKYWGRKWWLAAGIYYRGYKRDFWDAENVLYLDCGGGYTTICIENYKLKKVYLYYTIIKINK